MAKAKKETTFEKDLEQLEAIVTALEEGGLSLDDSLKRFEEGIRLSRACEKALSEAEKKIEILTKNAEGELEAQPFDEEEEVEEAAPSAPAPAPRPPAPKPSATAEPDDDDIPPEPEGELLF
jgi:exodeoxyribonuclease VII small subunit